MSNFNRLEGEIVANRLQILHLEAVPRSVSTALGRSLGESEKEDIYINEPFNRCKFDIEAASGHILDAAERHAINFPGKKLTIVTKNMARNLSDEIFDKWAAVCEDIVWVVRDPYIQMSSLATRIANDLTNGPGTDHLKPEDIPPLLPRVESFLINSTASTNFSKTSWQEMGSHFDRLPERFAPLVVDGDIFAANPHLVLRVLCRQLKLRYTNAMIDQWRDPFNNPNSGYNPRLTDETHAWTREAATSERVRSTRRKPIDISLLPNGIRLHIEEIALPVYRRMSRHAIK